MENMMITTNENDIRQPFATVTTTIHNPFSYCAGHNSIIGEMTIVSEKWEIFGFDIVPFIQEWRNCLILYMSTRISVVYSKADK